MVTTSSQKTRETYTLICSVADFHGINITAWADFRLLILCHWWWSCKVMCISQLWEPVWVTTSGDILTGSKRWDKVCYFYSVDSCISIEGAWRWKSTQPVCGNNKLKIIFGNILFLFYLFFLSKVPRARTRERRFTGCEETLEGKRNCFTTWV